MVNQYFLLKTARNVFFVLMITLCLSSLSLAIEKRLEPQNISPRHHIKIKSWAAYATWGGVGIIHNLTISNTSDIEYKNIKVRIYYTSSTPQLIHTVVSQETGVLPITLPPKSTAVYLKKGMPFGAASQSMKAVRIEVIGAEPST